VHDHAHHGPDRRTREDARRLSRERLDAGAEEALGVLREEGAGAIACTHVVSALAKDLDAEIVALLCMA
jgi:hypothetical protein